MSNSNHPSLSLREHRWFKLICGASFHHLPSVRNLALAYTLAGADCIDVAADPAVIASAREAFSVAAMFTDEARDRGFHPMGTPWLMVSLNDAEDPHFRKAEFDASACPSDCTRPCELICPAGAITFSVPTPKTTAATTTKSVAGVITERCYGCGRCLPVCPVAHIATRSYVSSHQAVAPLIMQTGVDAIEIHTRVGHFPDFARLWTAILPWVNQLKLISISCPEGDGMIDYLWKLYQFITPLPCLLLWQTDGRPMSGDIGMGTTQAAIKLGQKVRIQGPPGYVQLSGGTNHHTVPKLHALGMLPRMSGLDTKVTQTQGSQPLNRLIAGVAYGSYARALLDPVLEALESKLSCSSSTQTFTSSSSNFHFADGNAPAANNGMHPGGAKINLEQHPELLWNAVKLAHSLVSPLHSFYDLGNNFVHS